MNASLTSVLYHDAQASAQRYAMEHAKNRLKDNYFKSFEIIKQRVITEMMKSEENWERHWSQGIEAALKISRGDLIRI